MDRSFQKSLFQSALVHGLLLALLFLLTRSFFQTKTPILMDLTLLGEMSKGQGLGAPAAHPGTQPSQIQPAESDGEFSTPRKETSNPVVPPQPRPEVKIHKPLPTQAHSGAADSEAYLESLRRSAPIGLDPKKEVTDQIKTTSGVGTGGVAGTPDGSANIEGELAARTILRQVNPTYPDWAKKQGIEAVIRVKLTVLPSGLLKGDDLQVEQTSGYRELDRVVLDALMQWEFAPLPAELSQTDQSGVITFSFSLKNGQAP